jgi:hypothetical protein
MKRKILRALIITVASVAVGWTALTIYVEMKGASRQWTLGPDNGPKKVLIVFDPDPFYNLDEQVCMSFGKALAEKGMSVKVATVAAVENSELKYDAVVYCANTYNWRPDWAVTSFIEDHASQAGNSVAVTLGAGSTESSQKHLEKVIADSGGELIGSYSLWLWRPNDEQRMEEPNVEVAVAMAYEWGRQTAEKLNN